MAGKAKAVKLMLSIIAVALVLLYAGMLLLNTRVEPPEITMTPGKQPPLAIAIFGATGTIGDGLLKAALNADEVNRIYVVTRRASQRITAGVEAGKVTMILHRDYLDYAAISEILSEIDAVYWAIGLSAVGMEQPAYREIHVTFPARFMTAWLNAGARNNRTFHYVSGSGAKVGSRMMWAREKADAESILANLAQDSDVRVVSYRPAFILPTEAEAGAGQKIMHAVFSPIGMAIESEAIGKAMLALSNDGRPFANGLILENADIQRLSRAYE